jgi:hypothetical protein
MKAVLLEHQMYAPGIECAEALFYIGRIQERAAEGRIPVTTGALLEIVKAIYGKK